ncbi:MAG: homocysteine biosynthesis protein [Thermodesulfobacteriota bacterium]|jgi:uncharacterized protein (DUF39 family)|nr:MAG: homocysteine biosynthesis protein [Thermodesulfobacteriota bacterium]
MPKTIQEINEKIKKGEAVVLTAEEIIDFVAEEGVKKAAQKVDVVTTGTFGPMCSSGAFFNVGHTRPRIKLGGGKVHLNDVPAYAGLAAADFYLGATALPEEDPRNSVFPGRFEYGGGNVIEDLVAGKDVRLSVQAYGTDCYPKKRLETWVSLKEMNEAVLFNPRNAYQNYNVAVNISDKVIYTYMGMLLPNLGNATYSSAGQLSPLLNDPEYRTIGIGTRIFLGGGVGYVVWNGTQHNPTVLRGENHVPYRPAGTLTVLGDLKGMNSHWLRGASFIGYGCTLAVGIGIPIPILDEEVLRATSVKDSEIVAPVVDYSQAYPQRESDILSEVTYAQLRSGTIELRGKKIPTGGFSSYFKAREIALLLKSWIKESKFILTESVATLPDSKSGVNLKPLQERPLQ